MFRWKLLFALFFLLKFHDYKGCGPEHEKSTSPPLYNLNDPNKFDLPSGLDEISGISYYPKDSSLFAEIDEDGLLFKISLTGTGKIQQWRFDRKHDFEDIVLHDSTFYFLISNGDIVSVKFRGDSLVRYKSKFPGADKANNEFETLYYDDSLGLVMLCKKCEDDEKKMVTAFAYHPDSSTYTPVYQIDVKQITDKLKENKLYLKPSAAAINPLTNELYILASVNKLLVVADRKGNVKNVYTLDPATFNQPEGITFTPSGELIISNEKGDMDAATLLIFKPKKNA